MNRLRQGWESRMWIILRCDNKQHGSWVGINIAVPNLEFPHPQRRVQGTQHAASHGSYWAGTWVQDVCTVPRHGEAKRVSRHGRRRMRVFARFRKNKVFGEWKKNTSPARDRSSTTYITRVCTLLLADASSKHDTLLCTYPLPEN